MADEVDQTNERIECEQALIIGEVCRCACNIPKGEPGDCYYCGETFTRVIAVEDPATGDEVNSCGRCRDQRGIR